jgi:ribosomal protein L16 Arg81 hydroxylase
MASGRRSPSDAEYLARLAAEIAQIEDEARRLNRRLRNARQAVHVFELRLAALAADVERRISESEN